MCTLMYTTPYFCYYDKMSTDFYSPNELAKKLKVSYRTILREISRGNLGATRVGRSYIIKQADYAAYVGAELEVKPIEVAVAVVEKNKRVLIVKRRHKEGKLLWQFPAGRLKYAETPRVRAEIECLEETGVHCKAVRILGKRIHPDTKVVIHYLLCKYIGGDTYNVDTSENSAVMWVSKADALKKFTSDVYPKLKEYLLG
jgi:8-oxo-dGTP diphosphatase